MLPSLSNWWFILGREPLLSLAEIQAIFNHPQTFYHSPATDHLVTSNTKISSPIITYNFFPPLLLVKTTVDCSTLINSLGGTIKIARGLAEQLKERELISTMVKELETQIGKIQFGISVYNEDGNITNSIQRWGKEVKNILKDRGRSVRYVFKNEPTLSSVTVSKNGLDRRGAEFLVRREDDGYFALSKTVAVQPFESFSVRDYGRPGRDDKSGMLPPKLAMMMINLAGGKTTDHLLDPFCGSGTILTEALLLGYHNLIGADLSSKAVADTQKNIEWMESARKDVSLFECDVTALSVRLPADSVDLIVTEPSLGPPLTGKEEASEISKNCLELQKLYCLAFLEFKKLLRPGASIVFIFPRFFIRHQWFSTSTKAVPEIKRLGFEVEPLLPNNQIIDQPATVTESLLYHRPGQMVGREIWKFRFK